MRALIAAVFVLVTMSTAACRNDLVQVPGTNMCVSENTQNASSITQAVKYNQSLDLFSTPPRYLVTVRSDSQESVRAVFDAADLTAAQFRPVLERGRLGTSIISLFADDAQLAKIAALEGVLAVEPDETYTLDDDTINKREKSECQALGSEELSEGVLRLGANKAWSFTKGEGVVIAIVDTGIDRNHPDFAEGQIIGGKCFVTDGCANDDAFDDNNGHGTHVAGIAAAAKNSTGTVGIAPGASLYILKAFDEGGRAQKSDIVAALNAAITFRQEHPTTPMVINMSFGGSESEAMTEALAAAANEGISLVSSAGNNGDGDPSSTDVMFSPALDPYVIAVAAINSLDQAAPFSVSGGKVEFTAPGVDILSDVPDDAMLPLSGTSMSAPQVTGAVALTFSANLSLTANCVHEILVETAEDIGPSGNDIAHGKGVPQMLPAVELALVYQCQ